MEKSIALSMRGITKRFGSVVANNHVDLDVYQGEILSILGENGCGKTTLMNMIAGIYFPDEGKIYKEGQEVVIRSPKDAFDLRIGMIHQHFKLVNIFSAMENIELGTPGKKLARKELKQKVLELCEKYGLETDPEKPVHAMSVSEKQTVEILKVLYRGARILILDEPTAVLTPQETEKLFAILRQMRKAGCAVIIITHKLNEVLAISDRVTIFRKGKSYGTVNTPEVDVSTLTELMVGHSVTLEIDRPKPQNPEEILKLVDLTVQRKDGSTALDDVSFSIRSGEILGVAGIAGSGQKELCEVVAGLIAPSKGAILYKKENLAGKTPRELIDMGISMSFVPEDRLGMGLVGTMNLSDNMMLRSFRKGKSFFTDRKSPRHLAKQVVKELNVKTPSLDTPVRKLSGGNVQKVLVGREIASAPKVLLTAYAVRGLDINSSHTIYDLINQQKQKGVAVIYVGEDLDVLLELCDRILVLCAGKVSGIVPGRNALKRDLGMMMTKLGGNNNA